MSTEDAQDSVPGNDVSDEAEAGAAAVDDATIVAKPDDATIAVEVDGSTFDREVEDAMADAADDATIAVANEVDDATIAVAVDDATIAVATDATIAVPHGASADATIAVPGGRAPTESTAGSSGDEGAAVSGTAETHGPVVDGVEIPPSLAKLLFKRPLDAKRRAPESPFPASQSSLPRGGVRPDIPVVYGARPEELEPQTEGTDFARWIGPPPEGHPVEATNRESLPSVAKLNRQFSRIALLGGAGVLVVAVIGLWWIVQELF